VKGGSVQSKVKSRPPYSRLGYCFRSQGHGPKLAGCGGGSRARSTERLDPLHWVAPNSGCLRQGFVQRAGGDLPFAGRLRSDVLEEVGDRTIENPRECRKENGSA